MKTTCVDCMEVIEIDKDTLAMLTECGRIARLCLRCRQSRHDNGINTADPKPAVLGNYCCKVELQWAITAHDMKYLARGDVEEDFARRSWYRAREQLQLVAGCGHATTPIGHFHFNPDTLRRCFGRSIDNAVDGFMERYHAALNHYVALLLDLEGMVEEIACDSDVAVKKINFLMAAQALAVGYRQGWPVDPRIEDQVKAAENEHMPMGQDEAGRRCGL